MRRRVFTLLFAAALVLCAVTCALWMRREGRRSSGPQVVAAPAAIPQVPPATRPATLPSTGQQLTEAEQLVSKIRNDQVTWGVERVLNRPNVGQLIPMQGMPSVEGPAKDVADEIARRALEPGPELDQLTWALLQAMDDPDRFVVAHVILTRQSYMLTRSDGRPIQFGTFKVTKEPDGSFVHIYDNLQVWLKPQPEEWTGHDGDDDIVGWFCTASVDAAQMRMIKEQWQSRLAKQPGR
jgi:hypothetical protein